ncbi:putative membrane protein [Corynebacterium deserti GIMN1.010]|uniref:Putative membrane protein n=1 Tax=Corynebacterium deserti GIMN1.010 TaxID=931089 RepID=A0A0M4CDF6_9CORY|nr:hypothetical protein [Corynebacterium deserti]ALC05541.1 putative membrane protein [Corynebacterium deserti GIMN1.010]
MSIITSVLLLTAGAVLAMLATTRMSRLEPYGLIPHFIGTDIGFERQGQFLAYLLRAAAFFLLIVAASCAQPFFGLWALLLIAFGGFPSSMMVRQHNRRVRKMWRPRNSNGE